MTISGDRCETPAPAPPTAGPSALAPVAGPPLGGRAGSPLPLGGGDEEPRTVTPIGDGRRRANDLQAAPPPAVPTRRAADVIALLPPPGRAAGDYGIPYQLALAAQDLLDALLGDDCFDLAEVAPWLAVIAEHTGDGHPRDRHVWTRARVLARAAELVDLYNPPPELGGDIYPD